MNALVICPLCCWLNGVCTKKCALHRRIEELEQQLAATDQALKIALQEEWDVMPLAEIERRMILIAHQKFGAIKAAKALGIGKSTVYRRLHEYAGCHSS